MLDTEDLALYFDTGDFATALHMVRGGAAPVAFAGILSAVDEEGAQGYFVGQVAELRYPANAVTLLEGDTVSGVDPATGVATTWRVLREGRRVLDGLECFTFLGAP
ncbi:MAG: hypothetical protein IAE92_02460 [Burkholderiaceae bacterium]|nr:hypothetical protein [Burkholderiaceae bacterium]